MKAFINRLSLSYLIVNVFFLLTSFVILRRLGIRIDYIRVSLGAILISVFIASSITVFKSNLNHIARTVGGFILILPIVYITRLIFGVMVFRFTFVVYLFAILCAVIYGIAVLVVTQKYKQEEKSLNELLTRSKVKSTNKDDLYTIE